MRFSRCLAPAVLLVAVISVGGCTRDAEPTVVSRQALGTVITVTAYGGNATEVRAGVDAAFGEMTRVEAELDAYSATSTIGLLDAQPFEPHTLPPSAIEILDRIDALGVGDLFSPALLGVTNLYDYGGKGAVPTTAQLTIAIHEAQAFERDATTGRFRPSRTRDDTPPGLDFGGASKGLAIDRAMRRLRETPGISAAMITAGSSTQAWGRKPNGEPWRIGIEDPREPGRVIATVSADGSGTLDVSTSGDYQQYFIRGGVRYHHILDPRTGRPARGLRSLTVFDTASGLDADILSTALFVMGPRRARVWAEDHDVGLYAVDAAGSVIEVGPTGGDVELERLSQPKG